MIFHCYIAVIPYMVYRFIIIICVPVTIGSTCIILYVTWFSKSYLINDCGCIYSCLPWNSHHFTTASLVSFWFTHCQPSFHLDRLSEPRYILYLHFLSKWTSMSLRMEAEPLQPEFKERSLDAICNIWNCCCLISSHIFFYISTTHAITWWWQFNHRKLNDNYLLVKFEPIKLNPIGTWRKCDVMECVSITISSL